MKPVIFFALLVSSLEAWSQTERYEVYALRFASMGHPSPISDWADNGPQKDSINIDFMVWLVRGNNGKNILFDAGFLPDMKDSEDAKEFDIKHYVRPDSVLPKLGMKAGDITDIILSHPHWDHIDGLGLFPNARIWMQKEDYNYFVGAAWQKGGANGGFYKRDVRMLVDLNLAGRVTLVDGDNKEIIPGIKVFTGSRHTFNSQFVLVETGVKKIVLASDNIWIYYSLEHLRPAAPGGTFDTAAYVQSMRRMKTLVSNPGYIIPGHDAKIFLLFPKVTEGVVKIE
jgi:glyoxylase-like metal-dependent hydrolase (beta-lactamase superfamily II)